MHQLFSDSSHAMSRDGCRKEEGRSMLRFMICDDEPLQLSLLETYVREWAAEKKMEIRTDRFQNAEQLLFAWEEGAADIVLLDIDMPGMDGISLARRLRHKGAGVQILFVTGFADYALEGYEVEAVSYLIKPVEKGKLFACLDRAWERCGQEEPVLLVETPWGAARVKLRTSATWKAMRIIHRCTASRPGSRCGAESESGSWRNGLGSRQRLSSKSTAPTWSTWAMWAGLPGKK